MTMTHELLALSLSVTYHQHLIVAVQNADWWLSTIWITIKHFTPFLCHHHGSYITVISATCTLNTDRDRSRQSPYSEWVFPSAGPPPSHEGTNMHQPITIWNSSQFPSPFSCLVIMFFMNTFLNHFAAYPCPGLRKKEKKAYIKRDVLMQRTCFSVLANNCLFAVFLKHKQQKHVMCARCVCAHTHTHPQKHKRYWVACSIRRSGLMKCRCPFVLQTTACLCFLALPCTA